MKRLLNTLYVTSQGAYLSRDGETVQVKLEGEVKLRVPIHTLGAIVCFGNVLCSPFLLGLCAERGLAVSLLTERGRFLARIEGAVSGNVLLRRAQFRAAEDEARASEIARRQVSGKLANARTSLQRHLRDSPDAAASGAIQSAVERLGGILNLLRQPMRGDAVRGHEGDGARIYFAVFDQLVLCQKQDFFFERRSRRPPLDNLNALLSFLYTLLRHDVCAACESVGLDPAVGFLHRDRPGRPSLALDLMEELRPVLADRLALTLVNRRQIDGRGFTRAPTGAVEMNDECRKQVLIAYQNRKREELTHPFLDEKLELGLVPEIQARLLARHLRGELDAYPPFFWK